VARQEVRQALPRAMRWAGAPLVKLLVQLWVPAQAVHWVGKLPNKVNGKLCGIFTVRILTGNGRFWPYSVQQSTHRNPMMVPAERQLLDRIRKFKSHPYPA
jgi:hypothetical protein